MYNRSRFELLRQQVLQAGTGARRGRPPGRLDGITEKPRARPAARDRKLVARARRLERFLTQPFFTTEQFTGHKGKLVSLAEALDGCERILSDEFKDYPESALYMIGAIAEAKNSAAKHDPAKVKPAESAHES